MSLTAIDLFAGLGGFTEAARQTGVRVLWAANPYPDCVTRDEVIDRIEAFVDEGGAA